MKQSTMASAAAVLIILAAWAGPASSQYIDVPMDAQLPDFSHPNFASGTIVESIQNGEFTDPATWGGSVPGQGDTAVVHHDVALSNTVSTGTLVVANGGRVAFATTTSTDLRVGTLQIQSGGTVEIGNESTPIGADVTASITFRDLPVNDPGEYGGGLIVLGTLRVHGTALTSTFARLSTEPLIGDYVLVFESPVSDWAPGDRLAIPDTRQLRKSESGSAYVPQWEELTVASVSADGLSVTITEPLAYSHRGARDGDGILKRLPHVMNLRRNVEFRSENPTGTRGYIIATDRALVDVRYARFSQLGRTTNAAIDDTNIDARNPLRLLKLMGPTGLPAETPQFSLIGNAFDGGSAVHDYKWALGIDDSHYGLIADNVIYNAAGAGIAFWHGNETDNVLENNFVMRVIGTGLKYNTNKATGREGGMGASYWLKNLNNHIRDNVGANAVSAADAEGYVDFDTAAFIISGIQGRNIPNFKGADTSVPGEFTNVAINTIPFLEFSRNEFYGAKAGIHTDRVGDQSEGAAQINLLTDTTIWHTHSYGYRLEHTAHVVIDGMKIYGDPDIQSGIGVHNELSPVLDLQVSSLDIQGMGVGMTLPTFVEVPERFLTTGTATLSDSYLRNAVNLEISPIQRIKAVGQDHLPPRHIEVRNVIFESPATCRGIDIDMPYVVKDGVDTIQDDLIQVYDFNGNDADDFTLYFIEQHPEAIVPQTISNDTEGVKIWGVPEAGLTNEQALATYGEAIGGRIASCLDLTTHPTITGYTCDLVTGLGIDSSADSDGDGVPNISDAFPLDPSKSVNTLEACVIASNDINDTGNDADSSADDTSTDTNDADSSADNTSTNTTEFVEFEGVFSLSSQLLFWLLLVTIVRDLGLRYWTRNS